MDRDNFQKEKQRKAPPIMPSQSPSDFAGPRWG